MSSAGASSDLPVGPNTPADRSGSSSDVPPLSRGSPPRAPRNADRSGLAHLPGTPAPIAAHAAASAALATGRWSGLGTPPAQTLVGLVWGLVAACAIRSLKSGRFLGTPVARLPLIPTDSKRDAARLDELRAVVEQAADLDEDEDQIELPQSIRLLLGVIADCQLDILERTLR